MKNFPVLWLRRHGLISALRRRGSGLAWSGRRRQAPQAGVTLLELSFVVTVLLAIGFFVLTAAEGWKAMFGLTPEDQAIRQAQPKAIALQTALRNWFITTRCSAQAPAPPRPPLGPGSTLKATDQNLKDYAADGAGYLDDAKTYGTYTGCISRVGGLSRVQLYWEPPGHIDVNASFARRLQAQQSECLDLSSGACARFVSASSCLLWDGQLAIGERRVRDGKMLEQWLERFGITCDRDGDGDIDDDSGDKHPDDPTTQPYCDSNKDGDLGPDPPYNYDYYASDYYPKDCTKCLLDLDSNATTTSFGVLDFDSDDDDDVDAVDYAHWGC